LIEAKKVVKEAYGYEAIPNSPPTDFACPLASPPAEAILAIESSSPPQFRASPGLPKNLLDTENLSE
jgi:hypothetical protein